MVRITIDLDGELYDRFSVKCAEQRKKKVQVLRQLIKEWLSRDAEER